MTEQFSPGVVDYSDDPILPAWYVPGWTVQNMETNQFSIPAPTNILDSFGSLPSSDLTYVIVSGTIADGNNSQIGGYYTFEQSNDLLLTDTAGKNYRVPARLVGNIPIGNTLAWNAEGSGRVYIQFGQLNVVLLANDQPNLANVQILEPNYKTSQDNYVTPATWVYHVREYFMGGMRYDISVPSVLAPGPVDIYDLIIPDTFEPNHDWNRGY